MSPPHTYSEQVYTFNSPFFVAIFYLLLVVFYPFCGFDCVSG
jgi:hypothetical protein